MVYVDGFEVWMMRGMDASSDRIHRPETGAHGGELGSWEGVCE